MDTERRPVRPNSNVAKVHDFVVRGVLRIEMERATGLCGSVLTDAIRGNYRLGYVQEPSPEEKSRIHRENTSAAKGGVLLAVREYFPLDLTSRQTQVALEWDHGIFIPLKNITTAYARERHRHGLIRPIQELVVEARRDRERTPEQLLNIVRNRQAAYRLILVSGLEKPTTLSEWYKLEEDRNNYRGKVAKILGNETLVPNDLLSQRYLLTLYEARKLWFEIGDRSRIDNFPNEFEQIDPDIAERLKEQRNIIIKKTSSNGNGNGHKVELAESSEVKRGETGWS